MKPQAASGGRGPRIDLENRGLTGDALSEMCHPAGLVEKAVDWKWSSARWYEEGRSVGVKIKWVP